MNSKLFRTLIGILILIDLSAYSQSLPDLRTILDTQKGNSNIIIPKGKYLLTLSQGSYSFSGLKNVTIEGNGSEIICDKQTLAFTFNNCENLKFSNLSIDYQPLCFTQGYITAISSDKMNWDIKIHGGYPRVNVTNRKIQLFDSQTLELKKNFYTIFQSDFNLTQTTDSTFRLTKTRSLLPATENVGDLVVLDVVAEGTSIPHTVYSSFCKDLFFENITIYGSKTFSIFESDCENSTYFHCVITRKKNDPTVSFPRLRSGNADGIHSKNSTKGLTIKNCRVEYNGDDCIAVNGRFYPIYNVDEAGGYIYLLSSDATFKIQYQDSIVCVDNLGTKKGNSLCGLMRDMTPSSTEISNCIAKFATGIAFATDYTKGVRMKISPWISGLKAGDLIYSKERTGNNFLIENDTVGFNRARGMLIKASDGVVRNNIVQGCELGGIIVAPEFYWMEAGCSSNIEIYNNLIKNCLFTTSNTGLAQPGALTVISLNGSKAISETGVFNNIKIHDNQIEGCPKPCLVLTSIKNYSLNNNNITPDLSMIRTHGSSFGVTNTNTIWTKNLSGLNTATDIIKEVVPIKIVTSGADLKIINNTSCDSLLLQLYNVEGQLLRTCVFDTEVSIKKGKIPSGLCVIKISGSSISFTQKIII